MRDAAFIALMLPLLGLAMARPFVGVLLWSWISFMNPHRLLHGAAVNMPWATMAFAVTLIGCVVAREPKRLPLNAVTVSIVLLMVGMTGTSFVALAPPELVWDKWEKHIKVVAGVLLTASLLTDMRRVQALIWMMVVSLGYYGVKGGIFTLMTGGQFVVLGPADSMIQDRNHLATALLVAMPLVNYLRLRSAHRPVQLGLAISMGCMLLSALGSQSRGALVALVAVLPLLWWRSSQKGIFGILLFAAAGLGIAFMPDSWVERMNTITEYTDDESAMGRIRIWYVSFMLAVQRPLVGGGYLGMYRREVVDRVDPTVFARAAHSIWFETLGEHGFVVFGIWLSILFAGFLYTRRLVRLGDAEPRVAWAADLGRMAQVSMVAYMAGGSLLSLSYWDFFWTFLAILPAAYRLASAAAVAVPGTVGRGAVLPVWRPPAAARAGGGSALAFGVRRPGG
jgi:probable O-glycosylation ligase (exosortase A-associated)